MLELRKWGNVEIPLFTLQYKFQFIICIKNIDSSLEQFKNLIIFFKIKPSLGINNNIILRMNI